MCSEHLGSLTLYPCTKRAKTDLPRRNELSVKNGSFCRFELRSEQWEDGDVSCLYALFLKLIVRFLSLVCRPLLDKCMPLLY